MTNLLRAAVAGVLCAVICSACGCGHTGPGRTHLQNAEKRLAKKQFIAARHEIDLAIGVDRTDVSVYLTAMGLYNKAGRRQDEAEVGEFLVEQAKLSKTKPRLSPEQIAAVYAQMGDAYSKVNQLSAAESAYLHAVQLAPDNGMLLNNLGYFYADHNIKLDQALTLTRKAVKLIPNDGLVLDSLGWALFRKGRYGSAARTLYKAVELEPDDAEMRYHLGAAYAKLGRRAEARVELSKALLLDSALLDAKRLLASIRA